MLANQPNNKNRQVLLAMTPQQADNMVGTFSREALKGNITPSAFTDGLFEASQASRSPDYIRRNIRNTLKSPIGALMLQNPNLLPPGTLQGLGVNSAALTGIGRSLLTQAKKDNLLRDDVTNEEIADKLQRPLYNALRRYLEKNKNNPQINELIRKAYPQMSGGSKTLLESLLY